MSAESRSEWAVAATGIAAPILLWGCGASWLWVLLGGLLAVGLYAVTCYLQPEAQMTAVTCCVFGARLGEIVLWMQMAALALGAGWVLRQTGGIIPNIADGYPWIPVILSLLALSGSSRGRKAALSSGAVLFWLVIGTVGIVTVFSLPQIQLNRVCPEGAWTELIPALLLALLPVLGLYCRKPEARKTSVLLQLVVAVATAAVVFITTGCLSPRLIAAENLPFFTLAASCRLLGHAARFDAVFCMTVSAAVYCMLILMLNYCRQLTRTHKNLPQILFVILSLGSSWLIQWIPAAWIGAYLVLCWAIAPVFCAGFGKRKKNAKK